MWYHLGGIQGQKNPPVNDCSDTRACASWCLGFGQSIKTLISAVVSFYFFRHGL
jgi:hypothetical protein